MNTNEESIYIYIYIYDIKQVDKEFISADGEECYADDDHVIHSLVKRDLPEEEDDPNFDRIDPVSGPCFKFKDCCLSPDPETI